jgi:4-hydroxybutyryl-CoA dehydratase/vinylacetyl-CoA-Delta-isomerase
MALMTPEQYENSLKKMKPRVFMNGKKVDSILDNKNTRTVVESNKASYAWALDPRYKDIMTCYSPLIGEVVNRYTYLSASIDDLVKKARRRPGPSPPRCSGRAPTGASGTDAFHSPGQHHVGDGPGPGDDVPSEVPGVPENRSEERPFPRPALRRSPGEGRNQKTLEWPDPHLS